MQQLPVTEKKIQGKPPLFRLETKIVLSDGIDHRKPEIRDHPLSRLLTILSLCNRHCNFGLSQDSSAIYTTSQQLVTPKKTRFVNKQTRVSHQIHLFILFVGSIDYTI